MARLPVSSGQAAIRAHPQWSSPATLQILKATKIPILCCCYWTLDSPTWTPRAISGAPDLELGGRMCQALCLSAIRVHALRSPFRCAAHVSRSRARVHVAHVNLEYVAMLSTGAESHAAVHTTAAYCIIAMHSRPPASSLQILPVIALHFTQTLKHKGQHQQ